MELFACIHVRKTSLPGSFTLLSQHLHPIQHKIPPVDMQAILPEMKKPCSVLYLKAIHHHDLPLVDGDDNLPVCHAPCVLSTKGLRL